MLVPRWMDLDIVIKNPFRYIGIAPIVVGVTMAIMGLCYLKVSGAAIKALSEPNKLMVGNIYRYTRNPMYLGLALILLGLGFLLGGRCLFLPPLLFFLVCDLWIIRTEEKLMTQKFEQEFKNYCSSTRRWMWP